MTVPNSSEFIRVMKIMNGMVGELSKAIEPAKPVFKSMKDNSGMSRNLVSVGKRAKFIESEHKFWKGSAERALKAKDAVKLRENIEKTEKTAKTLKENLESFGKKMLKGKAGSAKDWGGIGATLAVMALLTADIKVREFLQGVSLATDDTLSADLTKAYSNISRAVFLSRRNTLDIVKIKDQVNKNSAEITGQNRRISDARKLGNDALAESRSYNKSLQAKITDFIRTSQKQIQQAYKAGNDALYETRQGKTKLDAQIKLQGNKIEQQKSDYNNQINQLKSQFQQLKITVTSGANTAIQNTLTSLKQGISEAKAEANKAKDYATTVAKTLELAKNITEALKTTIGKTATVADNALAEVNKVGKKVESLASDLAKQQQKTEEPKVTILKEALLTLESEVKQFERETNDKFRKADEKDKAKTIELEKIETRERTVKDRITEVERGLKQTEEKIKEQQKMDKLANEKLDKISNGVGLLPPLIRSVGNDIKTNTPTIPQIETAAANGTCRSLQPGGCSRKALDDLGNGINANTNNNANNILDAVNTGANAAQLTLLNTINGKLGDPVTGGLSGMLQRFSQNAVVTRVLNLLILASTLHNALMLSNNLAQTLGSIINNVLGFFGVKNGEGQAVDIGQVINSSVENFVKSLIGAEAYTQLSNDLAKANRIYQATTNLLNRVQSLHNSVLAALEVGFGWTAKVGNALKQWGVIGEKAYQWMNPQPNFRWRVFQYLETAQQTASTVETIVTSVVDVKEQVIQLANAKTELEAALGTQSKDDTATKAPEAQKVKEETDNAKTASVPLTFNFSDLFDGED